MTIWVSWVLLQRLRTVFRSNNSAEDCLGIKFGKLFHPEKRTNRGNLTFEYDWPNSFTTEFEKQVILIILSEILKPWDFFNTKHILRTNLQFLQYSKILEFCFTKMHAAEKWRQQKCRTKNLSVLNVSNKSYEQKNTSNQPLILHFRWYLRSVIFCRSLDLFLLPCILHER